MVQVTSKDLLKENLRNLREKICFPVINRGRLWYNKLNSNQLMELNKWYNDWLNVTETLVIPTEPSWLNEKLKGDKTDGRIF